MRFIGRITARLLGCCLALSGAAHAQPLFPNAGSVGMEPPPGMVMSGRFAGFEDAGTGASILIAEMPAEAFAQLDTGFTPEALRTRGIIAGEREARAVEGATAAFQVRAVQALQGVQFDKWILVVGASDTTAVITVQVPQEVEAYPDEAIEAALASVTLRSALSLQEQIASLPFKLGTLAGFRVVRVLAGSSLLLTEGPADVVPDHSQPTLIVASGLDTLTPGPESRDAFARRGFNTLPNLAGVKIETAEPFRHDDANWHRIEASAVDDEDESPLFALQVMRFTPEGWIRVVAICEAEQREALRERFLQLAKSVMPTR